MGNRKELVSSLQGFQMRGRCRMEGVKFSVSMGKILL